MKNEQRELFVKYEFHSYWDCEWIPELQVIIYKIILLLTCPIY